jgi:hypothetical protein
MLNFEDSFNANLDQSIPALQFVPHPNSKKPSTVASGKLKLSDDLRQQITELMATEAMSFEDYAYTKQKQGVYIDKTPDCRNLTNIKLIDKAIQFFGLMNLHMPYKKERRCLSKLACVTSDTKDLLNKSKFIITIIWSYTLLTRLRVHPPNNPVPMPGWNGSHEMSQTFQEANDPLGK